VDHKLDQPQRRHSSPSHAAVSVPARTNRKRIIAGLVLLVCVPLVAYMALGTFYYFAFCRHCFAFASTRGMAEVVVAYHARHQRLPVDYTELKRAEDAGEISQSLPGALYRGEWRIVSIEDPPRFATTYRATTDEPTSTPEELQQLLRDPATTQTLRLRGQYTAGYEISTATLTARELFYWDGTGWRSNGRDSVITLKSEGE
jgi:hypothetical protein